MKATLDQLLAKLPVQAGGAPKEDITPLLAMGEDLLAGGEADRKAGVGGLGGGGVECVVSTRHRQRELVDCVRDLAAAIAKQNREARLAVVMIEIGELHVGLRVFAVREDAAIFQLAD